MSFLLPIAAISAARKGAKKVGSSPQNYQVFTPGQHGSDYQGLVDSNPYANVVYRQSWIQKLLEGLGFRTNKDAYLESMALQAQEYDNQITQKEYNEKFDSPLAQVQRLKEAGLNPDLSGDVSSGESSPLVDDGNPPVAPVADDLGIVQQFASGVLSGVQAAFGIAGDIQNLRSLKLGNENKMMSLVKDAFGMIIPDIYEFRNNFGSGEISIDNYYKSLKSHYGHTMSRKQFGRFVERVNAFAQSAEGQNMIYSHQSNKAKNRKSMFSEISDPDQYSEWDDVMSSISDELSSLVFDTQKLSLQNQKDFQQKVVPEQIENQQFYEQAYDPTTAAKLASNPDNLRITSNQADLADYNKLLRSSFKSIMSKLDSLGDKGNKIAPIVKAVLSVWLMGMMPNPNMTINTGSRTNIFQRSE